MQNHSNNGLKMKVIAFAIQKGGQGKTKTALHAGYWGMEIGQRVLFVDLDPQNAKTNLNSESLIDTDASAAIGNLSGTLRDLARSNGLQIPDDAAVASGIIDENDHRKPAYFDENGAFIQVDSRLASLHFEMDTFRKKLQIARKKFELYAQDFDVCIIDTGPGNIYPLILAMSLADQVIAPCTMDDNAIAGLDSLTANLLEVRREIGSGFNLAPLGILPNRINRTRARHLQSLNGLRESAWGGHVLPVELYDRGAIEESSTRAVWRTQRGETSSSIAAQEMVEACKCIYSLVGLGE